MLSDLTYWALDPDGQYHIANNPGMYGVDGIGDSYNYRGGQLYAMLPVNDLRRLIKTEAAYKKEFAKVTNAEKSKNGVSRRNMSDMYLLRADEGDGHSTITVGTWWGCRLNREQVLQYAKDKIAEIAGGNPQSIRLSVNGTSGRYEVKARYTDKAKAQRLIDGLKTLDETKADNKGASTA